MYNNTRIDSPIYLARGSDGATATVTDVTFCPNTSSYFAFYSGLVRERYYLRVFLADHPGETHPPYISIYTLPGEEIGAQIYSNLVTHRESLHVFNSTFVGPHVIVLHNTARRTTYSLELRAPLVCGPGWYKDPSEGCSPCPAGYFTSTGQRISCLACEPGKFSRTAERECILCEPGTFASGIANRVCSVCPAGMGAPAEGASECISCTSDCDPEAVPRPPPPTPPAIVYSSAYSIYSIFVMQVLLVHTSPTPYLDNALILDVIASNFGLQINLALIPDPNFNYTLSGNRLSIPLISTNTATLSVVGRALQARNHTVVVGNHTVADFRSLRLFSTMLAKCVMGFYPVLPTNDTAAVYPRTGMTAVEELPGYSAPDEALATYTICPQTACLPGYAGTDCAVETSESIPQTTPIPVTLSNDGSLPPGEIAGIVIGSLAGAVLSVAGSIVVYKYMHRRTRGYTQANSSMHF